MKDIPIARKIFLPPLVVLVCLLAAIALTLITLDQQRTLMRNVVRVAFGNVAETDAIVQEVTIAHGDVSRLLALTQSGIEEAKLDALAAEMRSNLSKARYGLSKMQANFSLSGVEQRQRDAASGLLDTYVKAADQVVTMSKVDRTFAIPFLASADEHFKDLTHALDQLAAAAQIDSDAAYEQTLANIQRDRLAFLILSILGVLGSGMISIYVGHRIVRPIQRLAQSVAAFASGKTEVLRHSPEQHDEIGDLARAFSSMAEQIHDQLNEQREALEQQTATAEVLQVINASPGNLAPVFEAMLDKAMRLTGAQFGLLYMRDEDHMRRVAQSSVPPAFAEFRAAHRPTLHPGGSETAFRRLLRTKCTLRFLDVASDETYRSAYGSEECAIADLGGARSAVLVPLLKEETVVGIFSIYRQEVRAFSDKEVALLENFAAQAVIAMENSRLLDELRLRTDELVQRQEELRITFENMGDGVAMFDATLRLVAWNRKFQDILDVPDGAFAEQPTFPDYIRYLTRRGEYGPDADPEAQIRRLQERSGQHFVFERTRPNGRVIEVRSNPVPAGGFVVIYADITERKRSEAELRAARDAAEQASRTIEAAYRDLKAAQASLIQAEKMASLGQLTAGIAHEIKNPLNFVNNFSALSTELIDELHEALDPVPLNEKLRTEIDDLTSLLKGNLEKVVQHGRRADSIVTSMLQHSRDSSGERRQVDLNALVDEALNLAYHGARAQDQSFNITLRREFAAGIAPIELAPQDIMRVVLNLCTNGFYAARTRQATATAGFEPTLQLSTRDLGDAVEIRVRDNGIGIPAAIRDKLFQPFFTTKPTGEGTGLGLSISYDVVTKQHGGTIAVESTAGEYAEFTITLPRITVPVESGNCV